MDINKGDDEKRNYRSRVVAQEFNDGSQMAEDLFAGTPPLEAVRMLLSEAATVEEGDAGTKVIVVADVKKAFYEGFAKKEKGEYAWRCQKRIRVNRIKDWMWLES